MNGQQAYKTISKCLLGEKQIIIQEIRGGGWKGDLYEGSQMVQTFSDKISKYKGHDIQHNKYD